MTDASDGMAGDDTLDDHRIELEFLDSVLVITFDRPEVRNAFDKAMYRAVAGALSGALEDDEVHAVVLTGRGKAFTAGQDLPVDAFDRAMQNRLARGKLLALDNQIDSSTGTVRIKALFANQDHGLFPNQFVNVRMLTEVQENATLIPNSAVQISATSRFVFVVKSDDTVERRNVTIGRTEGEKTSITEGLAVGDVVVTEGLDRLQNGSRVSTRVAPPQGRGGPGGPGGPGEGGERKKKKKSQ